MKNIRIALCGNPNVGKSTVFNALTGLKQHTGNWAGKTVDSACGIVRYGEQQWQLLDLPGTYSFLNGSPEEMVTSDYLTFHSPDVVLVVCDATCLERSLHLAIQAASSCPKTILCINMMDEAEKRGIVLNLCVLEQQLGIPVAGITARKKKGLNELKQRIAECISSPPSPCFARDDPKPIEKSIDCIRQTMKQEEGISTFLSSVRALIGDEAYAKKLLSFCKPESRECIYKAIQSEKKYLDANGYPREQLMTALTVGSYRQAEEVTRRIVCKTCLSAIEIRQQQLDAMLSRKTVCVPFLVFLLAVVLYITLYGANLPSQWLSRFLSLFESTLYEWVQKLNVPTWIIHAFVHGAYRVTYWVVSVMLPPMLIFFPLFTLLEDVGLLPRIAFHLDKCFQKCRACGKQALCICMGIGCNAVGITGCRIIQSPRERMIAILTNALIPCNGRFPTLIALIGMFFVMGSGAYAAMTGAMLLTLAILLCIAVTLGASWILSRTVLKGLPSAFTLELPPFRRPKLGELFVRSILDRTLFVLGRAVCVAAPAGLLVWLLANIHFEHVSLLQKLAAFCDPFGRLLGMDGAILLAFVLGFPANEIVLPILLMIYMQEGSLKETMALHQMRTLLEANGWTLWTACSVVLFSLFHWPCSTATLTIYKETKSVKWTVLAVCLPAAIGCLMCFGLQIIRQLFF